MKGVEQKLPRGSQAKLARRFKVEPGHVSACAKGDRTGRPALERAIAREAAKTSQEPVFAKALGAV